MTIYIWPPAGTGSGSSNVNIFDSNGLPIVEGQQTMAASLPVVIASDQTALPITFGGPTNYGVPGATTPRQASMTGVNNAAVSVTNPMPVELTDGTSFYNAPLRAQLPTSLGQGTMAQSLTVAVASNQSALPVANFPTTVDVNVGTPTSSTIRTAAMIGVGATPAAVANPVPVELSNGASFYNTNTAAQLPTVLGQQVMASSLTVAVASDQSAIPVTTTPGTLDFGASAAAGRVAALVGNPTGLADFNAGASSAQTLRVKLTSDVNAAATPLSSRLSDGSAFYSTNTAAQLPATLGQKTMANGLAVTLASDQSAIPVTFSPLDFGASAAAGRVAALVGNVSGIADFGVGAAGAQTLRTAAQLGVAGTAVSVTNPVNVLPGDGTNAYTSTAIAAAQKTVATATAVPETVGLALGWDGTTHREISVSTTGVVNVSNSSLPTTLDVNYGTPGSSTLRVASMLGMGAAPVGANNPVNVITGDGTNNHSSAAIAASQFTVSTATSVPETAGLALGWDGTTHREISVTTGGAINVVSSNFPTTLDTNFGAVGASTLRTASLLGMGSTPVSVTNPVNILPGDGTNAYSSTAIAAAQKTVATATAVPESVSLALGWDGTTHREVLVDTTGRQTITTTDLGYGAAGAATVRVSSMLGMGTAVVSATNPVNTVPGNGTANYSSGAIAASQFTVSTAAAVPESVGLALGWDGTTHREIAVTTTGALNVSASGLTTKDFLALDTSSTNITSAAYVQLIASSSAASTYVNIFNGSGSILQLATGAAASETPVLVIPPGGVEANLAIAASTRISVRRYPSVSTDMTSGFFTIDTMG